MSNNYCNWIASSHTDDFEKIQILKSWQSLISSSVYHSSSHTFFKIIGYIYRSDCFNFLVHIFCMNNNISSLIQFACISVAPLQLVRPYCLRRGKWRGINWNAGKLEQTWSRISHIILGKEYTHNDESMHFYLFCKLYLPIHHCCCSYWLAILLESCMCAPWWLQWKHIQDCWLLSPKW